MVRMNKYSYVVYQSHTAKPIGYEPKQKMYAVWRDQAQGETIDLVLEDIFNTYQYNQDPDGIYEGRNMLPGDVVGIMTVGMRRPVFYLCKTDGWDMLMPHEHPTMVDA